MRHASLARALRGKHGIMKDTLTSFVFSTLGARLVKTAANVGKDCNHAKLRATYRHDAPLPSPPTFDLASYRQKKAKDPRAKG